ncbi:glycosyltransferase family 1 protein [Peribacillus muralis]|uniref:glycosyltransferase family 1 protein n=1 Tax=Peribacillus muralis TaxID=264697 RepID=UPI001F4E28EB|nr:glycosyltransferase family 1 protein [Peribacillus muralis]MCK1993402.1 glycosyltransferase family 1 protein [Peribacillus muralis]MCK2014310.1 glycosyltransferase family 1 protein [Peribacillus muralis]
MGDPLRILHVVVNMNRGGAETLIMNLYRNIDRSKIQFDFLTSKKGVFDDEIEQLGGNIHRIPYISDVGHFAYKKHLDSFFRENDTYKVVHAHMDKMSGLVLQSAKKAGIPKRISHSHNTRSEGGLASRIYKWYAGNLIMNNATNLLACSRQAARWLFKDKPADILKNGIECTSFSYSAETRNIVRKEWNIDSGTTVLGHVGRFAQQKNHRFLIDIFAEFVKETENAVLILIGEGTLKPEIVAKVKSLKLENKVKFLGVRSDINRVLQAFDVFIFPSLHEGLPVSLIEAQAAGLPCIISDRISREVDMGINLLQFLPIDDCSLWSTQLKTVTSLQTTRTVHQGSLSKKGYSINETANELKEFYLSMSG